MSLIAARDRAGMALHHHSLVIGARHHLSIPHRLILALKDLAVVEAITLSNIHGWVVYADLAILMKPFHLGSNLLEEGLA